LTGITAGPDGNIWFTETSTCSLTNPCSFPNNYAKITPNGAITEFPVGGGYAYNIATGPDGNLWSTIHWREGSSITRINPDGLITEFCISRCNVINYTGSVSLDFVAGPDNTIWSTENYPRISRFHTQSVGYCYRFPLLLSLTPWPPLPKSKR
jgi:virginiamycin B lyase